MLVFFLGCAKYQVSKAHRFAPLEDYGPRGRRAFERSTPLSSWSIALPEPEAQRLVERYAAFREGRGDLRLDLIVLGPGRLDRGLAPDPERFRLSFENALFRVYRPVGAQAGAAP